MKARKEKTKTIRDFIYFNKKINYIHVYTKL